MSCGVPAHVDIHRATTAQPQGCAPAAGRSLAEWPRVAWRRTVMLDALSKSRKRHSDCYRQETTKEREWTKNIQSKGSREKRTRDPRGRKRQADWSPPAPIIPSMSFEAGRRQRGSTRPGTTGLSPCPSFFHECPCLFEGPTPQLATSPSSVPIRNSDSGLSCLLRPLPSFLKRTDQSLGRRPSTCVWSALTMADGAFGARTPQKRC